jgi:hypothetical protein
VDVCTADRLERFSTMRGRESGRAESSAVPPRTSSPEAKESLWHARNIAAVR